jgi:hypothetical protein
LQVQAASGPTGTIILDTGNLDSLGVPDGTNTGTITLSGLINADGTGSGGGSILVFADQLVANDATVTASELAGQVGSIIVVTNSVTDNSGLTIDLNATMPVLLLIYRSFRSVLSASPAPTHHSNLSFTATLRHLQIRWKLPVPVVSPSTPMAIITTYKFMVIL